MTACPDLTEAAKNASLILSTHDTAPLTNVTVTCANTGYDLEGESQLTCLATGKWSSPLPNCIRNEEFSQREIIIIACSAGVVLILLALLLSVLIIYFRSKRKRIRRREERLAQTLEKLSIRDPLDELVRRESRRSSLGYQNEAVSNGIGGFSSRKLYKIWTNDRSKKTFAFADNLEELIEKGKQKLGLKGPMRIALEEDGTEIDSDEILRACSGQIMLLIPVSDTWRDTRVIMTYQNLTPDSTRF